MPLRRYLIGADGGDSFMRESTLFCNPYRNRHRRTAFLC